MSIRYMRQVIAERGIYDGALFLKEQGATLDEVYLAAFNGIRPPKRLSAVLPFPLERVFQRL